MMCAVLVALHVALLALILWDGVATARLINSRAVQPQGVADE